MKNSIERFLVIIISVMILCVTLIGCGKQKGEKVVTKDGDEILAVITHANWGCISTDVEYVWLSTTYTIKYNKTIEIADESASYCEEITTTRTADISDSEYEELYLNLKKVSIEYSLDCCDGSGWTITVYDTKGNVTNSMPAGFADNFIEGSIIPLLNKY